MRVKLLVINDLRVNSIEVNCKVSESFTLTIFNRFTIESSKISLQS